MIRNRLVGLPLCKVCVLNLVTASCKERQETGIVMQCCQVASPGKKRVVATQCSPRHLWRAIGRLARSDGEVLGLTFARKMRPCLHLRCRSRPNPPPWSDTQQRGTLPVAFRVSNAAPNRLHARFKAQLRPEHMHMMGWHPHKSHVACMMCAGCLPCSEGKRSHS